MNAVQMFFDLWPFWLLIFGMFIYIVNVTDRVERLEDIESRVRTLEALVRSLEQDLQK